MNRYLKEIFLVIFIFLGCYQQAFPQVETGLASWYGPELHANTTAGGEVFDMNKLTAAHPSLPFNTRVKVTNLKNQKSVIVRINDRGPFIQKRIIDLSMAAARQLEILHSGVARVKVEVVNNEIAENIRFASSIDSIPKRSIGAPFEVTRPLHNEALPLSKLNRNLPCAASGNSETD